MDTRRVVESSFSSEYSNSLILTDSDFILKDRKCAIAIKAEMRLRTAPGADFRREQENNDLFWKQKPGIGDVAALPMVTSQVPGKFYASW